MITASHNPPEFNGIKCIAGDGTECTKDQEDAIEASYHAGIGTVPWNSIGTVERIDGAAKEYIDSVISKVDADSIRGAGLKVVLDCANGCSCATSPLLLERLGVTTVVLNGEPDMRHPGHLSEPTAENLGELIETVKETGADLGMPTDACSSHRTADTFPETSPSRFLQDTFSERGTEGRSWSPSQRP